MPDNLLTTRYLLGAIDDLFEYYSSCTGMNLLQTESGILVDKPGWFNKENIEYRYKIRKFNPIWMALVSRSAKISSLINNHDWLRRRAGGSEYSSSKIKLSYSFKLLHKQFTTSDNFYAIDSPDLTMNSRILIADLLSAALGKGLEIVLSEEVKKIKQTGSNVNVETSSTMYQAHNIVICSPDVVSQQFDIPITTSYAPMDVVENVPGSEKSFVELDYYTKTCINLLKKENGIGLVGGITVGRENEIKPYLDYVIKEHKKRNPEVNVVDSYVGLKEG